ncbi:FAD binding domain-containing protein [Bradyrhizobium sp.]|uniref:FAD binding domain-containing protein n=1 Tax=Bradyrhizobium sp. TaxID=376 RepID=UPI003C5D1E0C
MKPGRFSYEAPVSLEAALNSLATWRDDAKIIAGGQSLAPMLNMRLARPEHLIDINGIAGLAGVAVDGDRLSIGALVRHHQLGRHELVRRHCPLLGHAAETIGHYAIRQRGTIGGSLAHADPAAQLPLAALALDAELELWSATARRTVTAEAFFVSIFTTAIRPDELLVAVHLPLRQPREGWGFRLFNRRAGDFAIVSVAATLARGEGAVIERLSLAIGGIGPVPLRVEHLVPAELVSTLTVSWSERVAAALAATMEIEQNERTPVVFRRELVESLTRDVLDQALERAQ